MPDLKQCNGPSRPRLQGPGPTARTCHCIKRFLAENIIPDYQSFIHVLEEKGGCTVLEPDPDAVKAYKPVYEKYKTIYPMIREFYHEV